MDIGTIIELSGDGFYRGNVFSKPPNAQRTFTKMMDVELYVNKLLVDDACRNQILNHSTAIIKILSHQACEIIGQLKFDYGVIEVSNGHFLQLSSRRFTSTFAGEAERDEKWSARAFVEYDPEKECVDAGYSDGFLNSLPDRQTRIEFLNKFYQCLFPFKMPQETRKLVVSGPKNSGKTSWANIFHRLITPDEIASITDERQFSASMIQDDTQLVLVDE